MNVVTIRSLSHDLTQERLKVAELIGIVSKKNDKIVALQSELTAARKALEEERERCAKVTEQYFAEQGYIRTDLADRIRALPSPQVKK